MEPQEQKAISSLFIAEYYKWLARARSQNRDDAYVREKICEIMYQYFGFWISYFGKRNPGLGRRSSVTARFQPTGSDSISLSQE